MSNHDTEKRERRAIVITHLGTDLYDVTVLDADARAMESHTLHSRSKAAAWCEANHPGVSVSWQ